MSIRLLASVALAMGLAVAPQLASATLKLGPLQISGSLQSQNLFQTPEAGEFNYIMNRNTANIRLRLRLAAGREVLRPLRHPLHRELEALPPLPRRVRRRVRVHARASSRRTTSTARSTAAPGRPRATADSTTTTTPRRSAASTPRDINDQPGSPKENRNAIAFENTLREAYVDVKFRGVAAHHARRPPADRLGRDRQLPHARPRQLARSHAGTSSRRSRRRPSGGTRSGGRSGCSSSSTTWGTSGSSRRTSSSGTGTPATGTRRSSRSCRARGACRSTIRCTNPVDGAFLGGPCNNASTRANSPVAIGPNAGLGACTRLMNNTRLFEQGDYARNPDREQPGRRALPRHRALRHGVHPQLLLPAVGGRRRHELRAAEGPADESEERRRSTRRRC